MRQNLTTLLLCLVAFSAPSLLSAQGIVTGKWSGSVTSPFGSTNQFTFAVSDLGDSLTISLEEVPGIASVHFADVHLVADTLRFTWPVTPSGAGLACRLERQEDGAFEGICSDTDGLEGRMRMVPPAEP